MSTHVMLSLDLEGYVSAENRQKVYAKLDEQKWTKVPNLTTTWRCSFKDGVSTEDAIFTAKADVKRAVDAGFVSKYRAAVMAGPAQPTEFN